MFRIFRHYIPKSLVILGTSEALILFGSFYLGVTIRILDFNPTDKLLVGQVWTKALSYAGVMMLLMASMGLYERALRDDLRSVLFRVGLAFFSGLLVMAGILYLVPEMSIGTGAFTLAFVCSVVGVTTFRTMLYRFVENSIFQRRVLVLGTGELSGDMDRLRRKADWPGVTLIGYVQVPGEEPVVPADRVLRIETSLLDLALQLAAEEIVVAIEDRRMFPINAVLDCKMRGIQVTELVEFYEKVTGRIQVDALKPSAMVFADGFVQAVLKGYIHRAMDIVLSLGALAVGWPVILATAVAIWLESGGRGPILYRQVRVGRNGKWFTILKFRSMLVDAEKAGAAQWAVVGDSRITRTGAFIRRTRIDEMPQVINVLRGEMSFVGPRPERPEFVAELSKRIPFYDLRHRVNPGITGWAQVRYQYGASEEDAKEKLKYDLYYIKNYSLLLDMMILVQTAQVILWGKGAR